MIEEDSVFGLIENNARFYSPTLGRFIQADSIIPDLTNSQAWNRYSYSYNNPLNYTDPSGHAPCLDGDCSLYEDLMDESTPQPDLNDDSNWEQANVKDISCPVNLREDYAGGMSYGCIFGELPLDFQVDNSQFNLMIQYIYKDLQQYPENFLFLWDLPMRRTYDTPFWDGAGAIDGITNSTVCFQKDCYERADVNYVAQGMIVAHAGGSKTTGVIQTWIWKLKYTVKPDSGANYWLKVGYDLYTKFKNSGFGEEDE